MRVVAGKETKLILDDITGGWSILLPLEAELIQFDFSNRRWKSNMSRPEPQQLSITSSGDAIGITHKGGISGKTAGG